METISLQKELNLGCGDNSCMFGPPSVGTNGGCGCFDYETPPAYRVSVRSGIFLLRQILVLPHALAAFKFIIKRLK